MKKIVYIFLLHIAIISYTQSINSYNYKLYDNSSGFANSVNDVTKDGSGMIWLSTDEGLWKFDGYSFIKFKSKFVKETGKSIYKSFSFENKIYIIFSKRGCVEYNTDTGEEKLITHEEVHDVALDGSIIYLLLKKNKDLDILILKNSESILYKTKIKSFLSGIERACITVRNKVIYLSVPHSGFYRIENHKIHLYRRKGFTLLPGGIFGENFKVFGNKIYFSGLKYPAIINDDKITSMDNKSIYFQNRINDFTFYKNQFFIIKDSKSILSIDNNSQKITPILDVDNIELKKIIVDKNSIFVATNQGLLEINKKQDYISNLNDDINRKDFRVRRKILKTDDRIYLFGHPTVLYFKKDKQVKEIEAPLIPIYDALKIKEGFLLGTEGKGLMFTNLNFKNYKTILNLNVYNSVCSVTKDTITNTLYAGDYHYLYKIEDVNTSKQKIIKLPNVFLKNMIKSIEIDYTYHRLLVGTDGGLFLVDKDNFKILDFKIEDRIIGDVLIDKNKQYAYIGDEKGLTVLRLSNLKIVKEISYNFLFNPKVTALLQDEEGKIWASTFSGIVGSDLKHHVNIYLQKRNGLINIEYNYKAKANLENGKIIFGGLNGYDIIDTHKFSFVPIKIKGTISGYHLLGNDTVYKKTPIDNVIKYKRDHYFARIYFTVPSIVNRERCNYDYRLNEGKWVRIKDNHYIDLLGFSAGDYHLEMRGFDEFGRLISFNPVKIEVREDFLNSNLFLYFVFGFLFLTLLFIFIFIIITKKKQYQLLEKVSMDLHEELGSLINKSNMILKKINVEGEEKSSVNNLRRYINQASYSLRVFINDIKAKEYRLTDLYFEIYELYDASLEFKNVKIDFNKSFDTNKYINSDLYRDIKLSLYELNNNFIKYSKANYLIINFEQFSDSLVIEVQEKNCSEEIEDIVEKGNGLKNITKRITRNNGSFTYAKVDKRIDFIIKVKI